MNVCHRPIDNGEGGIQRNAIEHFNHPARKWFDKWVWDEKRGTGVLHDVTREKHPDRKGMFTCEFLAKWFIMSGKN
jgi:AP endonuclease 2